MVLVSQSAENQPRASCVELCFSVLGSNLFCGSLVLSSCVLEFWILWSKVVLGCNLPTRAFYIFYLTALCICFERKLQHLGCGRPRFKSLICRFLSRDLDLTLPYPKHWAIGHSGVGICPPAPSHDKFPKVSVLALSGTKTTNVKTFVFWPAIAFSPLWTTEQSSVLTGKVYWYLWAN